MFIYGASDSAFGLRSAVANVDVRSVVDLFDVGFFFPSPANAHRTIKLNHISPFHLHPARKAASHDGDALQAQLHHVCGAELMW